MWLQEKTVILGWKWQFYFCIYEYELTADKTFVEALIGVAGQGESAIVFAIKQILINTLLNSFFI